MENKRPSASSSSITSDLFGPKDSSQSSGIFGSIFPPAPMMRRDPPPAQPQDAETTRRQDPGNHYGITTQANPDNGSRSGKKGDHVQPHHFSSSIYYGGLESYSSPHSGAPELHPVIKKKAAGKDGNGSNSNAASRGNWWEGSLYY